MFERDFRENFVFLFNQEKEQFLRATGFISKWLLASALDFKILRNATDVGKLQKMMKNLASCAKSVQCGLTGSVYL